MKKLLLVLLSLLFIVGCGEKKSNKITIVLDWTPNTNHTGLFVAKQLGYFDEVGIKDIEIVQPPEGSTTSLIGAGKAQFGISFQDTLAKAFVSDTPVPVTAVAALLQHNTSGIMSLKKHGIDRPKNMEGKNYASWDDEIELAIIKKVVTDDGGDFNKINIIPNTVTDVLTALDTDVDSVWVFYGWDGISGEVNNKEFNYFHFKDYSKELDFYTPVLIANNDYLKNNPEEAKKVVSAIRKGYEYAIAHPEEAAKILCKEAPELDEKLVTASQVYLSKQYQAEASKWGVIDQKRWDTFYKWLFDNQLIKKPIAEGFGFSNDFN